MSDQQSSSSDEDAPTEPTRYIRVSLRPPPRYAASTTDLDLWLKRFELYVRRIELPEEQWAAELLPLLDDEAFRVVSQLGLESSTDYAVADPGGFRGFRQNPPFGMDLVLRTTDDRLSGTLLSG